VQNRAEEAARELARLEAMRAEFADRLRLTIESVAALAVGPAESEPAEHDVHGEQLRALS
jgi:hypothetical protein